MEKLGREALSGSLLKGNDGTHEAAGVLVGRAWMLADIIEMMSEGSDAE